MRVTQRSVSSEGAGLKKRYNSNNNNNNNDNDNNDNDNNNNNKTKKKLSNERAHMTGCRRYLIIVPSPSLPTL